MRNKRHRQRASQSDVILQTVFGFVVVHGLLQKITRFIRLPVRLACAKDFEDELQLLLHRWLWQILNAVNSLHDIPKSLEDNFHCALFENGLVTKAIVPATRRAARPGGFAVAAGRIAPLLKAPPMHFVSAAHRLRLDREHGRHANQALFLEPRLDGACGRYADGPAAVQLNTEALGFVAWDGQAAPPIALLRLEADKLYAHYRRLFHCGRIPKRPIKATARA